MSKFSDNADHPFYHESRQEMRNLGIETPEQYDAHVRKSQEIVTKDSGRRQVFASGYQRDTEEGKPRVDLIPLDELDALQMLWSVENRHEAVSIHHSVDNTNPPITEQRYEQIGDETYRQLIPEIMIGRLTGLYRRGAEKYGLNNWQKGANLFRFYGSALRHLIMWFAGDTSEDHLAAVIWNVTTIMWTENRIRGGKLSTKLADAGPLKEWYQSDLTSDDYIKD